MVKSVNIVARTFSCSQSFLNSNSSRSARASLKCYSCNWLKKVWGSSLNYLPPSYRWPQWPERMEYRHLRPLACSPTWTQSIHHTTHGRQSWSYAWSLQSSNEAFLWRETYPCYLQKQANVFILENKCGEIGAWMRGAKKYLYMYALGPTPKCMLHISKKLFFYFPADHNIKLTKVTSFLVLFILFFLWDKGN